MHSKYLFTASLLPDASARGLDYKGVTHVLQFGMPYDKDSYIHRIGRTSRAEKEGKAILVLSAKEEQFVQQVLIGFDLRVNSGFQSLLNGPMEASVDDAIADMVVEMNDKSERNLRKMIVDTGVAMKAYFQSRRRQLNLDMSDEYLNQMSHTFMNQAGVKSLPRNQVPTSKPWLPGDPFDVGRPVSKG
jgi:superfamily II DNA/RNA helicase